MIAFASSEYKKRLRNAWKRVKFKIFFSSTGIFARISFSAFSEYFNLDIQRCLCWATDCGIWNKWRRPFRGLIRLWAIIASIWMASWLQFKMQALTSARESLWPSRDHISRCRAVIKIFLISAQITILVYR